MKTHSLPRHALLVPLLLVLVGCGGSDGPQLSDYLEEIEYNTPLESLKEVPVGSFRVSAAVLAPGGATHKKKRVWVQAKCKLFVVVDPKAEKGLLAAHERHKGIFNDMIVTVLRRASIDELSDPRWASIKTKISDAARSILGKERVRQVLIDEYNWEPV